MKAMTVASIPIPEGGAAFARGPSGHVEPWVNPAWKFAVVRLDGALGDRRLSHG